MIKLATSLASAILVIQVTSASAESYPDSFADYLNAHGLYFDYLSAAEASFWFKTSAGDTVLRMPNAVAPTISVVSAEELPSDAEVAGIRNDVELAMSSALNRLGVQRCTAGDQASCIPLTLQIGFSATHGDMIYTPEFRAFSGRDMAGPAKGYFGSHDRLYGMGCHTKAETLAAGEVAHLDAAFTLEAVLSGTQESDQGTDVDFGGSYEFSPQQQKPLTSGMEECLLGLLGVPIVWDLPREDVGYYVARSLETLHRAEVYLTHDQTANDISELVMSHALRKALGKEPTIGQ